jgi:hypothetical protein
MDLSELLDGTISVPVDLLGKKFTCAVFSAGWSRLTKEQRDSIQPLADSLGANRKRAEEIEKELQHEVPEDRRPQLEAELVGVKQSADMIPFARQFVPLMVKGIDDEGGEPLTFREKPFPEFVPELPDMLLLEITNRVGDALENPSIGEVSPDTLPAEAKPETAQMATTVA